MTQAAIENVLEKNVSTSSDEVIYAGFWIRLVASIIDTILLAIVIGVAMFLLFSAASPEIVSTGSIILNLLPIFFYIFCWAKYGATPGKSMLGLKIVKADTLEDISTGQAIIRYLGTIISSIILCIGFLMIAFTGRKQGLHDMIASTVVVKRNN